MKSLIYKTLFASIFFVCSCEEESNEKTTIEIGDVYQGGIVFYIDNTGEHGLIAAMEDVSTSTEWGCLSTYVDGADNLTLGSGYQNTLDIVDFNCSTENGSDNTASKLTIELVHNTYDDWYLPSRDELFHMYLNIGKGGVDENYNIGVFSNSTYWSSSESNSFYAWTVNFTNGSSTSMLKNTFSNQLRAIRSF